MMKSVVYVWAYYTLYCMCDNKQTHSSSSSWSWCNQGTAAETDAIGAQFGLTMWD